LDRAEEIGTAARALVEVFLKGHPEFRAATGFLDQIQIFAVELARWGARFNLTAAPDDPAELAFHLLDSLMPLVLFARNPKDEFANSLAAGERVLDLGSGAGFPGLILAASSEAEFVLVESRRKRANFLRIAIGAMGLSNVKIDSQYRRAFVQKFDVVTARAFARPAEFYEVAITAMKPDGIAMLYASERQRKEIETIFGENGQAAMFYEYEPPRIASRSNQDGDNLAKHLIVISRRREES